MTAKIFKYISAFSLGVSFTYFCLGYDPQSLVTLVAAGLSFGCYHLFKSVE